MFREEAVAGTLLVGAASAEVLAAFDSRQRPCVLLDNWEEAGQRDSILSDGFGGALAATRHLISLGHRRIAFVYDEADAPSFRDRRRGYICALWEAGVTPDAALIVCTARQASLGPHLAALLAGPDPLTGIVAANDMNAFEAMAVCREQGLSVPQDVSVVGFDDIPFGTHSYPPLTTVRVNKEAMGRMAVRRLLARVEECGGYAPPPLRLVMPVALVERASCAPPHIAL